MLFLNWLESQVLQLREPATLIQLYPFLLFVAILFTAVAGFLRRRTYARPLLFVLCCWCIICYVAYPFHYLWLPNLFDHVEPSVLDSARMLGRGMPLYHEIDSTSRYALLYGPNSFLLPRLGMVLFGESMTAFKLPGIILALTSLALTMSALRSSVTNSVSFSLGMIYFCGTMLLYREKYFWVRSDPQILFWTALGVFAASRRSAFVASAILGIAVGGCINVKIHTCLFFSPLVVMVLMRATIRDALVMVVAATAMMMLPFLLFPEISWQNYILWLRLAARHGLNALAFTQVLIYSGIIGMPLAVEAIKMLDSWSEEERRLFLRANWVSLLIGGVGIFVLLIMGSKTGAGEWHVMPLLPITAWLLASAHDRIRSPRYPGRDSLTRACQGSFVGMSLLITSTVVFFGMMDLGPQRLENERFRGATAEIRDFMVEYDHESVAMGYGDQDSYPLTFLRPLLPIPEKLRCDAAALGDMNLSGILIPDATLEALRKGAVRFWLIPRGEEPFTGQDYYEGKPLFSNEFRKIFLDHYKRTQRNKYFDVWSYQDPR